MTATATRPTPTPTTTVPDRVSFATLTRVEWTKATDTRAARWLVGLTALATVLIAAVPVIWHRQIDQTWHDYVGLIAVPAALLLPIVAIMAITTEWAQRVVLATFTQEPRRLRVLGAKLTVATLLAVLAGVVIGLVTAGALAISDGLGRNVDTGVSSAVLVGLLVNLVLNVLLGAAFGAVLQSTTAAVVVSIAAPTVVGLFTGLSDVVKNWFDPSTAFQWALDGDFDGHVANIVFSAALWVVLPLAAGIIRTVRREVT